jgi:Skp family chaperone for outer membrane proteins
MSEGKKTVRWYEAAYIVVLLGVLALSMTYLRPHRMGVIDMDAAFKRLGVAERLQGEMRDREKVAQGRFEELQRSMAAEEKELVAAFKAAETDEQKAKVQADFSNFQMRLQKGRQEIAGELQRYQRDAVVTFRERVRPYVQKVAGSKRVDIVIEPGQVFQIMNNAVNLTDSVVEEAMGDFKPETSLVDEDLLKAKGLWLGNEKAEPAPAAP